MRRLQLAEGEYEAIAMRGGRVDPGREAEALAALRLAFGLAVEAHRAYWRARRDAMTVQAAGAALYLRHFGRVCAAAGEPVPEFFEHEGVGLLMEADLVPAEAPRSRYVPAG
jgi:hypothetical protein